MYDTGSDHKQITSHHITDDLKKGNSGGYKFKEFCPNKCKE